MDFTGKIKNDECARTASGCRSLWLLGQTIFFSLFFTSFESEKRRVISTSFFTFECFFRSGSKKFLSRSCDKSKRLFIFARDLNFEWKILVFVQCDNYEFASYVNIFFQGSLIVLLVFKFSETYFSVIKKSNWKISMTCKFSSIKIDHPHFITITKFFSGIQYWCKLNNLDYSTVKWVCSLIDSICVILE